MAEIQDAIYRTLQAENPMTVRQLYYRLVSAGVIEKTEAEYKSTVVRLTGKMRRDRVLPFSWLADNTRWMRKPPTVSGLKSALRRTVETYRRAVWDNQDAYVEIWLEKDALAGVLKPITGYWDVPLMVTRGYSSLSFLHSAGEMIRAQGKPAFLYYLGDHDPSGLDITRTVERGIREFAPDADVTFERIAVTPDQIAWMRLPTRPTKKSDSRAKGFDGGSVEVDAIPPEDLRNLVTGCILRHVDMDAYNRLRETENAERESLEEMTSMWLWRQEPEEGEEE